MPLDLCAIFFLLYLVSIYSLIVDFSSEFYLSLFVARTRGIRCCVVVFQFLLLVVRKFLFIVYGRHTDSLYF